MRALLGRHHYEAGICQIEIGPLPDVLAHRASLFTFGENLGGLGRQAVLVQLVGGAHVVRYREGVVVGARRGGQGIPQTLVAVVETAALHYAEGCADARRKIMLAGLAMFLPDPVFVGRREVVLLCSLAEHALCVHQKFDQRVTARTVRGVEYAQQFVHSWKYLGLDAGRISAADIVFGRSHNVACRQPRLAFHGKGFAGLHGARPSAGNITFLEKRIHLGGDRLRPCHGVGARCLRHGRPRNDRGLE